MLVPMQTPVAQRYECKYLVSEAQAAAIAADVRPFVEADPFARGKPDDTYAICSLYLDDDWLSLYRETIEGKRRRFKLRVRSYGDALPLFCEVKRRFDRVISKLRCPIPQAALQPLLEGRLTVAALQPSRGAALAEFVRLVHATAALPRVLVRYDRQAYVGRDDPEVRVTFDRRLRTCRTDRLAVPMDGPGFAPVPTRGVVLELKYTDRHPRWLCDVVRRHELLRRSFSKYCRGIQGGDAIDLLAADASR